LSARFSSAECIAHIHAGAVRNAVTDTYSNANRNSAAYSNAPGQSDTQGAPNTASAP